MDVERILARLRADREPASMHATLASARAAGEAEELAQLGVALSTALATGQSDHGGPVLTEFGPASGVRALRDAIAAALAFTPGAAFARGAFALTRAARDLATPVNAARLAFAQPAEALRDAIDGAVDDDALLDFLAWLLQEMTLRGKDPRPARGCGPIAARLAERRHELAALPLVLDPMEREIPDYLASYAEGGGGGHSIPADLPAPQEGPDPSCPPLERADAETLSALADSLDWAGGSEGLAATARTPITAPSRAALATLGSLALGEVPARIALEECDAASAFAELFSAFAHGGAYTRGLEGARGRLRAWEVASAMAGAGAPLGGPASVKEIRACRFWRFGNPGFFQSVAWDVGLIALRPDRRSLALFAATDTD